MLTYTGKLPVPYTEISMKTMEVLSNLSLISVGCLVYIVGLSGIVTPHEFLNGGITGLSLIINYLEPKLNFGLVYAILNIPLFILGWFTVGRRFIYYTAFGITFFSVAAAVVEVPVLDIDDPIAAAILAGIICGIGAGAILRSLGSAGGFDILAVYLLKKYSLRMGMTGFVINSSVLFLGAVLFDLETAMYTLIFIFTQAKLTDAVVSGFNRRKSVMIISDHGPQLAEALQNRFPHGLIFLEGKTSRSGNLKEVVFSIISISELSRLKEAAFSIDPDAFVVVNETMDVMGTHIGRGREY